MSDLRMKASSGDGWDMAWDVDPPVWVVEIIALPSSPMRMEPANGADVEEEDDGVEWEEG
ncbi:hypothetical protein F2Q69_00033486 [Brassica cretica]|uniref:Uncharacterized protein n=1 Tax=Brassica cretica TaxID=69181 RepID=A0A8S9SNM8_BRACR|nr:hypothetical protein F2Q69_00033486 [Brassica cretica]